MRFPKLAALAASAAVAVGSAAAIAPAANASTVDTSHTYRITTSASLALDVSGGSYSDNAPVIQWGINGGANQSWRFTDLGNGYDEVVNVNSGKCLTLDYPGSPGNAGAGITQWGCNGSLNQQWDVETDDVNPWYGDIIYSGLQNGDTVDVPGGTIGWGTQLDAWPLHHGINQGFHLTQVG